jgi:hypothetical protein
LSYVKDLNSENSARTFLSKLSPILICNSTLSVLEISAHLIGGERVYDMHGKPPSVSYL